MGNLHQLGSLGNQRGLDVLFPIFIGVHRRLSAAVSQ
jgi:hypothetical protein